MNRVLTTFTGGFTDPEFPTHKEYCDSKKFKYTVSDLYDSWDYTTHCWYFETAEEALDFAQFSKGTLL